ncbi:hypothetical protein JK635_12095 [Neobacillus sp. YIM B02564]|uniref:Magnesium transporter MgtE intracellular domain-containing protein n=1 Tax=Neobacillus paridis TaxID=2803862 RepID=A0ABS1TPJ0_9BACI|nr:hypothetical protein [Neobacillus paridis]MBL4952954.1 hypothetical protein [Neobacillus paridis]
MEEKKHRKLKSFIFFGLFPILIMFILGLFLFNWLGFPVWETAQKWGNQVPVLNYLIPDTASTSSVANDDRQTKLWKEKYNLSHADLKKATKEIDSLNNEVDSMLQQLDNMKKTNKQLEFQLKDQAKQNIAAQQKKIAAIYENMSPSKAASIIEAMSVEDGAITISSLDSDQQSSILAGMKDTKRAAQITMLLKEIGNLNTADPNLLKQQLQDVLQSQDDPAASLADTIAAMPPAQAAMLIQSMMKSNAQTAMALMKKMNTNSRSQVLTEISKKDAGLAAQISVNLEK